MAKEFPYFKFFPGEWIKGDITLCSLAAQGLFINICAYYWAKDGIMSLTNVEQRFNASAELSELLENGVIYKEADIIQISFLEDQFPDFINKRKQCSNAGKQSGKMRRTNPSKLNTSSTDDERPLNDKIREDKIREDKKKETKKKTQLELTYYFDSPKFLNKWNEWKIFKKEEFNFKFKSPRGEQASLTELYNLSEKNVSTAIQIINQSTAKGWKGLFALQKNKINGNSIGHRPKENKSKFPEGTKLETK